MRRPLPLGIDNYKRMIERNYYYVDKTLFIKELMDSASSVSLFTRPRRFGKTLALSMIQTFFELDMDTKGNVTDNRHYFDGMKIMEAGENYTKHMGQYPVISLTLKSAKQPDFGTAMYGIKEGIVEEYQRHSYVLESKEMSETEKEKYCKIMNRKADYELYSDSIAFLSKCLRKYHGKNTIILIDEYDVPLENSYFRGFYGQMIDFIRSLFESSLKTNDCLEFAVITGCLRISKESIFTGLNNLRVVSILAEQYGEHFGFIQTEVDKMIEYYGLLQKHQEIKDWYDGYLFGDTEVYNPWSLLYYVEERKDSPDQFPAPYWSNTSSNSIVKELIENADAVAKQEIELLIEGGSIEKQIHEDITYNDIHETQDNLWNFLFFTGYLKAVSRRFEGDDIFLTMEIPNREVKYIYRNTILVWFEKKLKNTNLSALYNAVKDGDSGIFEEEVCQQLIETISVFDYAESYYHGFLAELLRGCPNYVTLSNRESGNGRPDIIMKTVSVRGMAIIMELKVVKDFEKMEAGCDEALAQIEEQNYTAGLYREGYRKFLKYGICFYRKECMIKKADENK